MRATAYVIALLALFDATGASATHLPSRFSPSGDLIEKAQKRFPYLTLTEAEKALLEAVQVGDAVVCIDKKVPSFLPSSDQQVTEDPSIKSDHTSPCFLSQNATSVDPRPDYQEADYTTVLMQTDDQRTIRSEVIRWLVVDPKVSARIEPRGIWILGARIRGRLDLSYATISFPITLRWCGIPDGLDLVSSTIRRLNLEHSHTGSITATNLVISPGSLFLRDGFEANGEVYLLGAHISGGIYANDARFRNPRGFALRLNDADIGGPLRLRQSQFQGELGLFGAKAGGDLELPRVRLAAATEYAPKTDPDRLDTPDFQVALNADHVTAGGNFDLAQVDVSLGTLRMQNARVAGTLSLGGNISRSQVEPGQTVVSVSAEDIELGHNLEIKSLRTDGLISIAAAAVGNNVSMDNVVFVGSRTTGLSAPVAQIKQRFIWKNITCAASTILDLRGATVGTMLTEERDWSRLRSLFIDGFNFSTIQLSDSDSSSENLGGSSILLRWLQVADRAQFSTQPYRAVSEFLEQQGNEGGARRVLEAMEEARMSQLFAVEEVKWWTRTVSSLIKCVGVMAFLLFIFRVSLRRRFPKVFTYLPMLLVLSMISLVLSLIFPVPRELTSDFVLWSLIGYGYYPFLAVVWSSIVISFGTAVVTIADKAGLMRPTKVSDYADTLHPFLYSLNVFLPVIDLHQEKHWWPDAHLTRQTSVFGHQILCRGAIIRNYLWLQILLGWLLSGFFVAGLSGLVKHG